MLRSRREARRFGRSARDGRSDHRVDPLSPAECEDFRLGATDPTIQSRLDSGALDPEAFVDIIE